MAMHLNGKTALVTGAGRGIGRAIAARLAAKPAVEAFTRIWAAELAPRGITVNSVLPGMIDTDLIADSFPAQARANYAARQPFGRIGLPGNLADVVAFLVSDDARWISGQDIVVNGGAS